jgi:hypothetical protein
MEHSAELHQIKTQLQVFAGSLLHKREHWVVPQVFS